MRSTADESTDCLRFAGLELKDRFEVSLACEIWLDDACNARWATDDTMKLSAVIAQAIKNNDGRRIEIGRLDHLCSMKRDCAVMALRQMRMFGLIAEFRMESGFIAVTCRLSHSGEIRFLDMKRRFDALSRTSEPGQPQLAAPRVATPSAPENKVVAFRPRSGSTAGVDVARGQLVG